MLLRLLLLVVTTNLQAQIPVNFEVTLSRMPLEVFRGAFLEKVPGVALYDSTVCNLTSESQELQYGWVRRALVGRIVLMNPTLMSLTVDRARKKSVLFKIARTAEWMSWVGGFLAAGGVVKMKDGIKAIFPILSAGSDKLSKEFEGTETGQEMRRSLEKPDLITLGPRACESRLVLGSYKKEIEQTWVRF